jgi:hypothetical protein
MGQATSSSASSSGKRQSQKRKYRCRRGTDKDLLAALTNTVKRQQQQPGVVVNRFPVEIIPQSLFLSDAVGVTDISTLQSLGITHVLNVGGGMAAFLGPEAYSETTPKPIQYKILENTEDFPSYPMLQNHWEEAMEFMDDAVNNGGCCVVHCYAGQNRSALMVCAYYMVRTRTPLLETVKHCYHQRGTRAPFLTNPGFREQLVALARYENLLR